MPSNIRLVEGAPCVRPGAASRVAIGAASVPSGALTGTLVRLVATAACHIAIGAAPTAVADGTSHFLPANVPEFFRITSGHKVAVIQDVGAGFLYITVAG
jgi:hypothetical protein